MGETRFGHMSLSISFNATSEIDAERSFSPVKLSKSVLMPSEHSLRHSAAARLPLNEAR